MNILVTGCAGYIGSTLVGRLLERGHTVYGVDSLMYNNAGALMPYFIHDRFVFHCGDVRDIDGWWWMLAQAQVVIPLAALVGAPLCERKQEEARAVNRDAVVALARSLSPFQRLLYPNTNSGYGQTDGNSFVTEKDPLNPISVYGVTKCEAEKAVLDHPNSAALRLATVFGASPRMRLDLMVNDFTHKLANIRWQRQYAVPRLSIFEPHFKRNFVGVQDVARAFVHLAEDWTIRGCYNLGLPTANLTKLELAHTVCKVLGLSRDAVCIGDGTDADKRNYLVSNDKILATGFEFRHTLEHGIEEVARVVRSHAPEQLAAMRNV